MTHHGVLRHSRHRLVELAGIDGHLGAHLLSRRAGEHVELTVLTHWTAIADVRALAGHDENKAVVKPSAREVLIDHDP